MAREGLGESQFRRGDIHCGTLYIYMYFVGQTGDDAGVGTSVEGRRGENGIQILTGAPLCHAMNPVLKSVL
jgi:hypothetical protein